MTDLLPNRINQLDLRIHAANAELTVAPLSDDEFGDRQAAAYLSNVVLHRGAHGLRVRSLICPIPQLVNSFRLLFPIVAPSFLRGAGTLFVESLSFEYEMLSTAGSVPQVVASDGTSTLEVFTDFTHNGGQVQLSFNQIGRFREALGIALVLNTPVGQPVSLNLAYLGVRLATSTRPLAEPGEVFIE